MLPTSAHISCAWILLALSRFISNEEVNVNCWIGFEVIFPIKRCLFFDCQIVAGSVAGRLKTTLQNGFILFYTVLLEIKQNPSLSVFIRSQRSSYYPKLIAITEFSSN